MQNATNPLFCVVEPQGVQPPQLVARVERGVEEEREGRRVVWPRDGEVCVEEHHTIELVCEAAIEHTTDIGVRWSREVGGGRCTVQGEEVRGKEEGLESRRERQRKVWVAGLGMAREEQEGEYVCQVR